MGGKGVLTDEHVPRANRYFIPGYVWHITHRCQQGEFLLRFGRDRQVWLRWLFEAKKRYGIEVLNFTITSNHIHLVIYGDEDREVIPRSMQLVAERTAQEYNRRTQRYGAFWEDRYHATAIDTDDHLAQCLVYIDLLAAILIILQSLKIHGSGDVNTLEVDVGFAFESRPFDVRSLEEHKKHRR